MIKPDQTMLTAFKEYLHYNPLTGELSWKKQSPHTPVGYSVGGVHNGYITFQFRKIKWQAHRVIWFLMTGAWPDIEIDHDDRDGTNNKWINLRLATRVNNMHNTGDYANNTTGFKGVVRSGRKFAAQIRAGGTSKYLGTFSTPAEAHSVYVAYAKTRGEFCPYNKKEPNIG